LKNGFHFRRKYKRRKENIIADFAGDSFMSGIPAEAQLF